MTGSHPNSIRINRLLGMVMCAMVFWGMAFFGGCAQQPPSRSACEDSLGCVWIEPDDPVRLVSLQTFSGPLEPLGLEHLRSLEMHIRKRGGIHGHRVVILQEDEKCSPAGGLVAAQKIASDRSLVAIHGPNCSSAAVQALPILSNAGMVMVSGTATAPSLTALGGKPGIHHQPGFFRTVANDQFQGIAAASLAHEFLEVRRAAVIHDQSPYALGLVESFSAAFREMGGEVVFTGQAGRGDRNMRPLVQAMAAHAPELLFFPIFQPEAEYLVEALRNAPGLSSIHLLGADSTLNRPFVESCGHACLGMFFIAPDLSHNSRYELFLDRYIQSYGAKPVGPFHAHGYDAAAILIHALEQASFLEPDGSLRIERQRIRDVLSELRNFPGLTGNLTCDPFGDCGVPRFKLVRLDSSADFEQVLNNTLAIYDP